MQAGTPSALVVCNVMIRVAAQLVPRIQREAWTREWLAELQHRWQFLFHIGEWNAREAIRLLRSCLGAFPDAAWHFAKQEAVQNRVRQWARSPWVCLAALAASLLLVAALSSGLAATRSLLLSPARDADGLMFIWLHAPGAGGDKGLPPDAAPDWATHSRLLESAADFNIRHQQVTTARGKPSELLVVNSDPSLFRVLRARPAIGKLPVVSGIVLDHRAWIALFHADPRAIGSVVSLNAASYKVAAVLPSSFQFVSRRPTVYLVQRNVTDSRVMVIARAKPGVSPENLQKELARISADVSYYFFGSDLRLESVKSEIYTPLAFFAVAVSVSIFMAFMLCRPRLRQIQISWKPANRKATLRRSLFFLTKTALALGFAFAAGLESSRSESSILVGARDPATGPLLLWLYILGAMGAFFWSLADQRARCRVCLRLLCFPVRIGCPGCLLLDWSGTELACTEGHGVLHVPLLAPSWEEEPQHWISLDESWSGLFAHTKS